MEITYGFFDESGNTGTSGDYYVVAVILFHSTEEVFKSKAVLKRERKNNKRFNLKEFKFHDMHIGGDHLKTSLKRVLKNLSNTNFDVYATIVKKPKKQRYAFDVAKLRLILELFRNLAEQGKINKLIELKADDNCFGKLKEDQRRTVFCKCKDSKNETYYLSKSLSYEEFKTFDDLPGDIKEDMSANGWTMQDYKIFSVKAVNSETEGGVQIADLIAGSIYQKYNNKNNEYFDIIKSKVKNIFE